MKAFAIDPQTQTIEEIDIEMQANTTYTFFKSILIDDLTPINKHIVYTDANALSEGKKSFFIGEQLIMGVALIVGKSGVHESDVTISKEDLEKLTRFEMSSFYEEAFSLLGKSNINLYRPFDVKQGEQNIQISAEWVLFAFDMADERTKEYFLTELKKVIDNNEDVAAFVNKLGQLATNAAQ